MPRFDRSRLTVAACCGCASLLAAAAIAIGQEGQEMRGPAHQPEIAAALGDMQGGMEAWMKASTPGEPHKYLKKYVGTWDTEAHMYMDGPESEPMKTAGRSEAKMALGGRYVQEKYTSTMMGQPFEGMSMFGYNNIRRQFVSTWFDTMSTSPQTLVGNLNPDGSMLSLYGMMDEPMTGEYGKPYSATIEWHSDDHYTMKMYEVSYGEPFMVMQIDYRRAE